MPISGLQTRLWLKIHSRNPTRYVLKLLERPKLTAYSNAAPSTFFKRSTQLFMKSIDLLSSIISIMPESFLHVWIHDSSYIHMKTTTCPFEVFTDRPPFVTTPTAVAMRHSYRTQLFQPLIFTILRTFWDESRRIHLCESTGRFRLTYRQSLTSWNPTLRLTRIWPTLVSHLLSSPKWAFYLTIGGIRPIFMFTLRGMFDDIFPSKFL